MANPTDGDAAMAQKLQREELQMAQTAQPVPTYEGYNVPVPQATAVPGGTYMGPGQGYIAQPMGGISQPNTIPVMALGEGEQRLMNTYSLGRGIRILSIIDGCILLINTIVYGPLVLLFVWGPVAGFLSAKNYNPTLAIVYFVYYILRIVFDVVMLSLGSFWFIVSVVVDIMIARYVWTYVRLLRAASVEELNLLRTPTPDVLNRAQPYFRVF